MDQLLRRFHQLGDGLYRNTLSVSVFKGEDNSASDDDDLTDGRRMIKVRAGQGRAGQGRAGQGRAGQGRAGQGRAGQGRAGQGRAGQGRAGQGRAGQGRAGQGRGGEGRGGDGERETLRETRISASYQICFTEFVHEMFCSLSKQVI